MQALNHSTAANTENIVLARRTRRHPNRGVEWWSVGGLGFENTITIALSLASFRGAYRIAYSVTGTGSCAGACSVSRRRARRSIALNETGISRLPHSVVHPP